VQVKNM